MDGRPSTTRLPARSRLPTASSTLGPSSKRTAATAQLDNEIEHALTRRKAKVEAFSASMAKSNLERRAADAEQARRTVEADLAKTKQEKEKVERDRRWFAEREKDITEERDAERASFEREKAELTSELKTLRGSIETLQRQFDALSDSHDEVQRAATRANRACEDAQNQLSAVQGESEYHHAEAMKYRNLIQLRDDEILELKQTGKVDSSTTSSRAVQDPKEWELVRKQLLEQTDELRRLKDTNAKMSGELLVLRERHANIEVLKEEKRILERRVRDADAVREQLGLMEAEVDALRQEREKSVAFAQRASDIPVAVTQELAKLRLEHANLLGQQNSQAEALARRDQEIKKIEDLLMAERDQVLHLKLRLQASEVASNRTESRFKSAQQEIDMLNGLLEKFTRQEQEDQETPDDVTEHTSMHIAALEQMIADLKEANEALVQEMNEMGGDAADVMSGSGRGSITALKEALLHERTQLSIVTQKLEDSSEERRNLERQLSLVEEDLYRLRGDVGTGHHVPPGVRVLEMADNPAARWFGKREEDIQRLQKENEALRGLLSNAPVSSGAPADGFVPEGLVPKETLDVLIQEKSELETKIKAKEKMLLRLQQIFSLKAEEFKTTVTSLLGWKFKFQQNGAVQLKSIYDPNALIVFSQPSKSKRVLGPGPLEGEDIKVQLIAEDAPPEVRELYRTWVEGFGCVPGFLGSLSVQLFESSPEGAAKIRGSS